MHPSKHHQSRPHCLYYSFYSSEFKQQHFFQCSSMGFGYFSFRAPWCCVNDGFLFWCELFVERSSRCLVFSGVFPMHFHTGTEDQCPEAHYILLTHENVCVDVFMWCVCVPSPFLPTHQPTHITMHYKTSSLTLQTLQRQCLIDGTLYKYVTWLTLTPIG